MEKIETAEISWDWRCGRELVRYFQFGSKLNLLPALSRHARIFGKESGGAFRNWMTSLWGKN